jgi:hypothetical protein
VDDEQESTRAWFAAPNARPSASLTGWAAFAALVIPLLAPLAAPTPVAAQEPERVRVFLDCQTRGCPEDEFRSEIPFVDWVRDRTVADLHVILTSQSTSGGTEYIFDLVGRNDFEEHPLTANAAVAATATQGERLATLTRTFKAALAGYVARRGYAHQLDITGRDVADDAPRLDPAEDPWRMWVFTVGVEGEAEGEERQREFEVGARFNANRTTPDWKVNIGLDGEFTQEEFELSEGVFTNRVDQWELDLLAVRSITPHWSAGMETEINSNTRINRELGGRAAAAIEWNYFPYEQANRRQLLVHYQLGYSHVRYEEETIFEKLEESLLDQRVAAAWQSREPWGDGSLVARYSGYLHDGSKYRLSLRGDLSIRLFRGLGLDLSGGYQLIRDQIYLAAEELDDEEILVQRRQLATGYEYDVRIGLSYRFGSIFNNVVNNRFPYIIRRF